MHTDAALDMEQLFGAHGGVISEWFWGFGPCSLVLSIQSIPHLWCFFQNFESRAAVVSPCIGVPLIECKCRESKMTWNDAKFGEFKPW
jgi:hypothetical protein